MVKEYFLLYLIYGFAMMGVGIFSLQQKDSKVINLSLIKSLKYLGFFGILHGMSEWITMVLVVELYPDYYESLFHINQILKAVSFALFMYFGLDLLPLENKHKNIILKIPVLLFLGYLAGSLFLIVNYGASYPIINPKYNIVAMRYAIALPGGIITAIALYLNAKLIEKTKSIPMAGRYKSLAWIFLLYGLLEGLLVKEAYFFPANIINRELFLEYFRFPTLALKAAVGLVIYFLLIKVIDTFSWEQEEKLNRLEKHRIASEERRKLGLEIHDSIIQGLYAAGLKIEYLTINKDGDQTRILDEVKNDLNSTMNKIREFLSSTALDVIELEDLNEKLQQLVQKFNENQSIKISLQFQISPLILGRLSPEKSTQIYYMIQEAVSNVIKHSKADRATILVEAQHDLLSITVTDNGIGISQDHRNHHKKFGISSMKERTQRIGGSIHIDRIKDGTRIELKVPWEESDDEGQNQSIVSG